MTTDAAELLGIRNKKGSIENGYDADIVAFSNNPLNDIENINSIKFVMKKGNVIINFTKKK